MVFKCLIVKYIILYSPKKVLFHLIFFLLFAINISACNNDIIGIINGDFIKVNSPIIEILFPKNESSDIPVNSSIIMISSEEMDMFSLQENSFLVKAENEVKVLLHVEQSSRLVYTFTPINNLDSLSTYNFGVYQTLRSQLGEQLENDISITFNTANDKIPPDIPVLNIERVSLNTNSLTWHFNDINSPNITDLSNFVIYRNDNPPIPVPEVDIAKNFNILSLIDNNTSILKILDAQVFTMDDIIDEDSFYQYAVSSRDKYENNSYPVFMPCIKQLTITPGPDQYTQTTLSYELNIPASIQFSMDYEPGIRFDNASSLSDIFPLSDETTGNIIFESAPGGTVYFGYTVIDANESSYKTCTWTPLSNTTKSYSENLSLVEYVTDEPGGIYFEDYNSNINKVLMTIGSQIYEIDLNTRTGSFITDGNDTSKQACYNSDGSKIVFATTAEDFNPDATNQALITNTSNYQIAEWDRATGDITFLTDGAGQSYYPVYHPDGNKVVFTTKATNFITTGSSPYAPEDDHTGYYEIAEWTRGDDLDDAKYITDSARDSENVRYDNTGDRIVFDSEATNINNIYFNTSNADNIFEWSRDTGGFTWISQNTEGQDSMRPRYSDDGNKIVFESDVDSFNGTHTYTIYEQIVEWDRATGINTYLTDGNAHSSSPRYNNNNTKLVFSTRATNFYGQYTNTTYEQIAEISFETSTIHYLTDGDNHSLIPFYNEDSSKIIFETRADNFTGGVVHTTTGTRQLAIINRP